MLAFTSMFTSVYYLGAFFIKGITIIIISADSVYKHFVISKVQTQTTNMKKKTSDPNSQFKQTANKYTECVVGL